MAVNSKRVIATLSLLLLMVFMQAGRGDAQNAALQNTWQGYVTDTHCGTNCQVTKDMTPDKKCADRCVRKGSKYGLLGGQSRLCAGISKQSRSLRCRSWGPVRGERTVASELLQSGQFPSLHADFPFRATGSLLACIDFMSAADDAPSSDSP
jgi:hypothetical protein